MAPGMKIMQSSKKVALIQIKSRSGKQVLLDFVNWFSDKIFVHLFPEGSLN
jgi:hypothetical protein